MPWCAGESPGELLLLLLVLLLFVVVSRVKPEVVAFFVDDAGAAGSRLPVPVALRL